jgi:hypothetical protein
MSAKRRRELPLYRKTSAAFLARPENRWCAWPGCWLPAECVQHAEGRVGDRYLDESTWLPSCWEHNGYAEDHPDEARAVGFSRSRLTP